MNQKEINELISRSRQSLRDWNNLKDQSPSKASYCDMQIGYELDRLQSLQGQLAQRVELEDFAREYCRCGDDDLSEFSNDQLEEAISDRTADLAVY
jgi:hypothetical protein|tara:strand:- start:32 stop:319 length:288 start_codon:yes stop_codon:yes gene_type:complete